jgi:hypothetical protein
MSLNTRYRAMGVWIKIVAILLPVVVYLGASYVLVKTRSRTEWRRHVERPRRSGARAEGILPM